jgi:hypothetical protein
MTPIAATLRRVVGALTLLLVLALSASGTASAHQAHLPARVPPLLACLLDVATPHEQVVDTAFSTTIECTVTGASRGDGTFALNYHLVTPEGATNRLTETCRGTLKAGKGTCKHTFGVPYVFSPRDSWVVGTSLPSGHKLGPAFTVPVLPPVTV